MAFSRSNFSIWRVRRVFVSNSERSRLFYKKNTHIYPTPAKLPDILATKISLCNLMCSQTHFSGYCSQTADFKGTINYVKSKKGNGSPYSITQRRVLELIPVLGSQPAGDTSHKSGGRLPLLSARPAVTPATLKRAATYFTAWWTEAWRVWTVCLRLLPDSVMTATEPGPYCAGVQHANHSDTEPRQEYRRKSNFLYWDYFYEIPPALFLHCLLGNRNGSQPVKSIPLIFKGSLLEQVDGENNGNWLRFMQKKHDH